MRPLSPVVATLLGALVSAQTYDARDVVRTRNGDEVRGRVSRYYAPDALLLLQGNQRVRVPRADVASVETVNDRLREFYRRLEAGGANAKYRWMLAEWAEAQGLPGMARALALEIVIDDDAHEPAHELLGHAKTKRGWRWPLGDRSVDRERWLEHHADMGHPLTLTGEHYTVETDAEPKAAVYALLDLERLYLHWMDTFGEPLQLREALSPLRARIWRSRDEMPGLSSSHKRAYSYAICVAVDHGTTCMVSPTTHEVSELFMMGTQMAIGATLADAQNDGAPMTDLLDCPWAIIGLAQWMETCFTGAPGRAQPRAPQLRGGAVARLKRERPNLKRLLAAKYPQFYDANSSTQERWDSSWALAHFLLDPTRKPDLRDGFHRYLSLTIAQGAGLSSSTFDKAIGVRIEDVQKAMYAWIASL